MTEPTQSSKNITVPIGTKTPAAAPSSTPLDQPIDPRSFPHHVESPMGSAHPPATIQNVAHLMTSYGIEARYNVIKKKLDITIPRLSGSPENFPNVAINYMTSLATLNGIATGQIANYVDALGDSNQFNPVADWITSKPWDGKDRLHDLFATLTTQPDFSQSLRDTLVHRWLLSATSAALLPAGFYGRGVLTLQGPQSIGKTSWFSRLIADRMLRDDALLLGHHLDAGNKDSLVTAVSHWIVEIGELDSSFKKDVARLKGFITGKTDKVRRPYAKADSEYQRRTVFCATVNEENFLIDQTGNTRWWTIPVVEIDYKHDVDMQQVFAQLAVDIEAGAQWWLTREEELQLEAQNKNHRAVSSIEERLLAILDFQRPQERWVTRSATQMVQEIGISNPSNPQCRECGRILREHFGPPKKIQGIMKWRIPLKDHGLSPEHTWNPTRSVTAQDDDDDGIY